MPLSAEYWLERAARVRKTIDCVFDDEARDILRKIADNYESLARKVQEEKQPELTE
jgi:type II restriction/modification system DNA methylase subunit YeeA